MLHLQYIHYQCDWRNNLQNLKARFGLKLFWKAYKLQQIKDHLSFFVKGWILEERNTNPQSSAFINIYWYLPRTRWEFPTKPIVMLNVVLTCHWPPQQGQPVPSSINRTIKQVKPLSILALNYIWASKSLNPTTAPAESSIWLPLLAWLGVLLKSHWLLLSTW